MAFFSSTRRHPGSVGLQAAIDLGRSMVDLFWDETSQQFYDTGSDHEALVIRPRDLTDNAAPAGSSMAVSVLLRLAVLTGDSVYNTRAATSLRSARAVMQRFPTAAGHWLGALGFYLSRAKEVVIVGERGETVRPPTSSMRFFAITCLTGSSLERRARGTSDEIRPSPIARQTLDQRTPYRLRLRELRLPTPR